MSRRAVSMRPVIRLVAETSDADCFNVSDARRVRRHHRLSLLALRLAARELRGARMVLAAAERVSAGEGLSSPQRCTDGMLRAAHDRVAAIEREVAVIYRGRWLV